MKQNRNKAKGPKASAFTLIVVFICSSLIGLALLPLLPIKLKPSHVLPSFSVRFSMPNATARVVEMTATCKLEAMLARMKGIRSISSTSGNGWGIIWVSIDKYTDLATARFEASCIIRQTYPDLPDGISYPQLIMQMSEQNSESPFMTYTINAPYSPSQIKQYAEEHIKPVLSQLSGIYKINISGATPMEWTLEYDPEQLRLLGVGIHDISRSIQQHYQKGFLGVSDLGDNHRIRLALVTQHNDDSFDASQIAVIKKGNRIIYLNELVTTSYAESQPQSHYRINGQNSIYLSIIPNNDANQLSLSEAIKKRIDNISSSLPSEYLIQTQFDSTEFMRKEINKMYARSGLTIIILLLFVWLVSSSTKYLFLIVASLTTNLAIASIMYYLLGLEMHIYSLTGITISVNLMIDNTIIMSDHYLRQRNRNAFLSILAATLTTIGALSVIFFLDEKIRLNLQDFAAVVIVNMSISLLVALFFIPALIDKTKFKQPSSSFFTRAVQRNKFFAHCNRRKGRLSVHLTQIYSFLLKRVLRYRIVLFVLLIITFGIPIFLLPNKIEKTNHWASAYNQTIGSTTYRERIKPLLDKALGGTLRLFVEKVGKGNYSSLNEESILNINANLPNGSTLEQMNRLISQMENYLSQFPEIKQFQTSVINARKSSIKIYFTQEHQHSGFPYILKNNVINHAMQLGGGSWIIYGLKDNGFNNEIRESAGSSQVIMFGYNYDELYSWAEKLKNKLLQYKRIKEVTISPNFSWWKDDYTEFYYNINKLHIAEKGIDARSLYAAMRPTFDHATYVGAVSTSDGVERITLSPSEGMDQWSMHHLPIVHNQTIHKLSELATVDQRQAPQEIAKENQQYRLCLQYEYIGSSPHANKLLHKEVKELSQLLPMGYTAKAVNQDWNWDDTNHNQYLLLLIIIVIIYLITGILFNSLLQPLAIICVIPVSYIGVFLSFYWGNLNFDQGGFASFVLLSGITVNASIYILNEYNAIRSDFPQIHPLRAYLRAWNTKSIPIFLTIASTILGFIPFIIESNKEGFWFPLAVGTIGGLIMSFIGITILLPILALPRKSKI